MIYVEFAHMSVSNKETNKQNKNTKIKQQNNIENSQPKS